MSATKHTPGPGPWRTFRHGDEIRIRSGEFPNARTVAVVLPIDAEDEANANLIEASPDLLAVAEEFVELYRGIAIVGDSMRARLARARAAIAKALGDAPADAERAR